MIVEEFNSSSHFSETARNWIRRLANWMTRIEKRVLAERQGEKTAAVVDEGSYLIDSTDGS